MKEFKYIVHITLSLFFCHFIFTQPSAYAAEGLGDSIDCTDVSVDYREDSSLTREERLRLMDTAFFQSLNKFELCQEANRLATAAALAAGSSSGGDSAGADGDSGEAGGETGGAPGVESVASTAMSGTEPSGKDTPVEEGGEDSGALQDSQDVAESGNRTGGNVKRATGKLPEDIPSANNDDTLAAQIRYAAESETDPVKKRQLWNEYRKYKGLPTK